MWWKSEIVSILSWKSVNQLNFTAVNFHVFFMGILWGFISTGCRTWLCSNNVQYVYMDMFAAIYFWEFSFVAKITKINWFTVPKLSEPRSEKTSLRGFRPGPTQTGLCSYRRWLEAWNFGFRKKRDCTIRVAKTKALISFAVTAKLICVFVFAYAKSWFSRNEAHMMTDIKTSLFVMVCVTFLQLIDIW